MWRLVCIITLAGGMAMMGSCTSQSSVTSGSGERSHVHIAIDRECQTLRHFGASAAWWAQEVGSWPEETVDNLMDLLYDERKGIGLDLIRYNLGGGKERTVIQDPLRMAHSIESSPGVYDAQRDAAAIQIIDKAVQRGAKVLVFANSPPGRLTVTGAPTGNGGATNLLDGAEQDYASYLAGCVEYLSAELGWPIEAISPINEPQWDWAPVKNQEGCHYTPEQAAKVVRALIDTLKSRTLPWSVSAVDSSEMKVAANAGYIGALTADAELAQTLEHYAVHAYWSSPDDREQLRAYMNRAWPNAEIWMTEWTEMKSGRDFGMDSALELGVTVWMDLVLARVSSWQYWIAASPYQYRDGLVYLDTIAQTCTPTKRLWALGHWSRFVEPGAKMLETTVAGNVQVLSSAFIQPDGSVVCVFVNRSETGTVLEISGFDATSMDVHRTSETEDLLCVYAGSVGPVEVPPESLVTVVLR